MKKDEKQMIFSITKNSLKYFLSLFCFFLLVFFFFYIKINEHIFLDVFTQRDIQRAFNWLNGHPYWPGPEMSTGGNLPGPFFYFLLIPPLVFGENIYHQSLIWFITWLALSWTMVFYFAIKIFKHEESLLIFIMFLLSCVGYSLYFPLFYPWNPAFAMMFHILALITLYYWRENKKNVYLYSLGLIIGLGIQVHFLVFIHFLTALYFFIFQRKKKARPFIYFIVLILVPNLPYFFMQILGFLDVTSYSTDYLSSLGERIFSEKWFKNIDRITSFRTYIYIYIYIYIIGSLFYLVFLGFFQKKKYFKNKTLLIIIIIPVFTSFLIARTAWYLNFVPVFLALLFSNMYDNFISKNGKIHNFLICGILFVFPLMINFKNSFFYKDFFSFKRDDFVICSILVIIFLSITKRFSYKTFLKIFFFIFISKTLLMKDNYEKPDPKPVEQFSSFYDAWMSYNEIKPLFKQIALETNWSAERAMNRIFLMHGGEQWAIGLFSYYVLVKEELKKESKISKSQSGIMIRPDGYFILQDLKKFGNYAQKDWKRYLSSSLFISDFVKNEIKADKILIQPPKLYNKYWLISYKTTDQSAFYEGLHNTGQPYYWEEPDWLKNCSNQSTSQSKNKHYYCMILPGHRQRAGVFIKFSGDKKKLMEIGFFGPLLGLKYEETNYDGFAFWSNIRISFFCDGKNFLYSLPDIGYNLTRNKGSLLSKISRIKELASPLKLRFFYSCEKNEISFIKLSFNHLRRTSGEIPEKKEIVWKNF